MDTCVDSTRGHHDIKFNHPDCAREPFQSWMSLLPPAPRPPPSTVPTYPMAPRFPGPCVAQTTHIDDEQQQQHQEQQEEQQQPSKERQNAGNDSDLSEHDAQFYSMVTTIVPVATVEAHLKALVNKTLARNGLGDHFLFSPQEEGEGVIVEECEPASPSSKTVSMSAKIRGQTLTLQSHIGPRNGCAGKATTTTTTTTTTQIKSMSILSPAGLPAVLMHTKPGQQTPSTVVFVNRPWVSAGTTDLQYVKEMTRFRQVLRCAHYVLRSALLYLNSPQCEKDGRPFFFTKNELLDWIRANMGRIATFLANGGLDERYSATEKILARVDVVL